MAVVSGKKLNLTFVGRSVAGLKTENQDAFAAHLPKDSAQQFKGAVAIMADGVSSSPLAKQASQTSINLFVEDYYATPDSWSVSMSAGRVLTSLNNWLHHHGRQAGHATGGMLTTFSALIIKSNTGHIFHVGDSRVYRCRNQQLEQLTCDHQQSDGFHKASLTRALGMDGHLKIDYQTVELRPLDRFVLSSDGMHDFLSFQQFQDVLNSHPDAESCTKKLVDLSLQQGSDDNSSCLIVDIDSLPSESIEEGHRRLIDRAIPPVLQPGQRLENFEVLQILHSGTRSHLYLVCDDEDKKWVLKAPSDYFSDDPQYLEGFIREAWVGQQINHHNVMRILPANKTSPFLYHLCEYIDGQSLRQWMLDNPEPPLSTVRQITKGIVGGMRAMQRRGMVHRDLKPENVMITNNGQIKLIDFGTVLVDGLQEINTPLSEEYPVGSVDYIAPEYLSGESGNHRSDLFSLAVIIFEMLSGQLPFGKQKSHPSLLVTVDRWQYRTIRQYRADIPLWVDKAIEKGCAPSANQRYSSLSEFTMNLYKPDSAIIKKLKRDPLIERHPVRVWQTVSLILGVLCVFMGAELLMQ